MTCIDVTGVAPFFDADDRLTAGPKGFPWPLREPYYCVLVSSHV